MGMKGNAYLILVHKSEGKRPLGRPGHMGNDNFITNFKETGGGRGMDWIQLAHDYKQWLVSVKTLINLWVT